jgi:hypothetical protein
MFVLFLRPDEPIKQIVHVTVLVSDGLLEGLLHRLTLLE